MLINDVDIKGPKFMAAKTVLRVVTKILKTTQKKEKTRKETKKKSAKTTIVAARTPNRENKKTEEEKKKGGGNRFASPSIWTATNQGPRYPRGQRARGQRTGHSGGPTGRTHMCSRVVCLPPSSTTFRQSNNQSKCREQILQCNTKTRMSLV